ncbi:MAG: aminoacyl-tRNA hydrolase, partial [Nitrospinae bacterium]|nr:aminoacyl-tRNA hydrolase [Nitrospinota bacterium]
MFLIIGLGNPGPRYELTRHNAGFLALDNLADKYKIKLTQHKYRSLYGKGEIEGLPVILAKPMTYMNESGKAVIALLSTFNLSPEKILVLHDDIELPLGKLKTKLKGGDGG